VNSTAITANDTAVRLRSLRNLDCSLAAGGADDPFHLVRGPMPSQVMSCHIVLVAFATTLKKRKFDEPIFARAP